PQIADLEFCPQRNPQTGIPGQRNHVENDLTILLRIGAESITVYALGTQPGTRKHLLRRIAPRRHAGKIKTQFIGRFHVQESAFLQADRQVCPKSAKWAKYSANVDKPSLRTTRPRAIA